MDRSSAVGEYLRARRALLTPAEVGFVTDRNRKVVGLRREEVAALAGISPEYYLRLEQGRDHQPSDQVLAALAGALRVGPHGEEYLRRLVRRTPPPVRTSSSADERARLEELLGQWRDVPAFIADANLDVVASNALAEQLVPYVFGRGANRLLVLFEQVAVRELLPEWERHAREVVGALRMGGDPSDPRFQEIVGSLSVRSPDFRRIWGRYDVHVFVEGDTGLVLPPFGSVSMGWRNFAVADFPGHVLTTFFARPGTDAGPVLAYFAARAAAAAPGATATPSSAPERGAGSAQGTSYSTTTTRS